MTFLRYGNLAFVTSRQPIGTGSLSYAIVVDEANRLCAPGARRFQRRSEGIAGESHRVDRMCDTVCVVPRAGLAALRSAVGDT